MEKQQNMIDIITECGKRLGKKVVFEQIALEGLTEKVMKYAEDCETDDGVHFRFAIYVHEDGMTRISSFVGFNPFDENIELTNAFFEELNNRSEAFEYSFNEIIMVSTYVDEDLLNDLGEDLDEIIFEITKDELCRLRIATILLVDKEVKFDDAIYIALGNDEEGDNEFNPADFMYWFEHRVLIDIFLEEPKAFVKKCLGTMESFPELDEDDTENMPKVYLDNFIYGVFSLLAKEENITHDFSAEDFTISTRMINGKYKLLSISFPEPIRERLCYRMDIIYEEGKEEVARLFTIEKSEKERPFLCSWMDIKEKRTHLNYNFIPKNSAKYDETLVNIYERKLKEMASFSPKDND